MLSWMTTAVAILFSGYLPSPLPPLAGITAVLLSALIRRWRGPGVWVQLLLALSLGATYASLVAQWRLVDMVPLALENQDLTLRLRLNVAALPIDGDGPQRVDAQVLALVDCSPHGCPDRLGKLRLSVYGGEPTALADGSEILATVRLKRPRGYASLGAFDYGRWLFVSGYAASGYIRHYHIVSPGGDPAWRDSAIVRTWRQVQGFDYADLMLALLFGERGAMGAARWQRLTDTGTGHLLAISGMHIGMVAAWGYGLGRLLSGLLVSSLWASRLPPLLAMAMALSYGVMAGFSLPTRRALFMILPFVLASLLQRRVHAWQCLALALLGVAVLDPLAAHQPGFALSFGAVLLLFWHFQGRVYRPPRGAVLTLLETQWLLGLGLLPLLAGWQFPVASAALPANMVAVPLIGGLVLPLLLLGFLLSGLLPGLALDLWFLADVLFKGLFAYLSLLQQWLPSGSLSGSPLVLVAAGLGALLLLRPGLPGRLVAIVLLMPLLSGGPGRPPPGQFDLRVLDVGQGLSVIISTETHTLVYDLGPAYDSGFNTAEAVLLPGLRRLGVSRLDGLVLSHNDRDHLGGAAGLLNQMSAARIYHGELLPPELASWSGLAQSCHLGQAWRWDGVDFRFVSAQNPGAASGNAASCVLLVGQGAGQALLPGDIPAAMEARLLSQLDQAAVVVAPHHGSKTSSSPAFVSTTRPQWVVYSAGYKHAYGHPAATVAARYRRLGARCWLTGEQGSVALRLSPLGVVDAAPWRRGPFYWQSARSAQCPAPAD